MLIALLTIVSTAALSGLPTRSSSASIGVSATVVRPAEIDQPEVATRYGVITIRNTEDVQVSIEGGIVRTRGPTTTIVPAGGANRLLIITLTY